MRVNSEESLKYADAARAKHGGWVNYALNARERKTAEETSPTHSIWNWLKERAGE